MVDVIDEVPEAQLLHLPQAERLIKADVKLITAENGLLLIKNKQHKP